MSPAKDRGSRLSALGKRTEKLLQAKLTEMEKDLADALKEGREPKYSLTDLTKVLDRALKLEAIRNKIADSGEGGFYEGKRNGGSDE